MGLPSWKKIKNTVSKSLDTATDIGGVAANPRTAALGAASRAATIAKRGVRTGKVFGTTLGENVKREANTPGSEGQRFMRAPLGQYYLPGKVQKALGYVTESPGAVISSYKQAVKEGGARGGLRAGLTTFSVLSTPMMVSGVARVPKLASAVAGRASAISAGRIAAGKGSVAAGEFGGGRIGQSVGKQTVKATQKKVAAEVAADIAKPVTRAGEFTIARKAGAIHINDVPVSQIITGKATVPGLTKGILKSEGFGQAFAKVNRGGAASMTFRAEVAPTAAVGKAPMAAAPKAMPAAEAAATAKTAAPVNTTPKVAPKPKMPSTAASEATQIEPRMPSRTKSVTRPGPVRTRPMTPAEKANFDQPTQAAQTVVSSAPKPKPIIKTATAAKPVETGGTTASAKPTVTIPKGKAPAAPKAPAAATVKGGQQTIRGEIRDILSSGKAKRGSYSGLARKYNVSRQRVSEITKAEAKRMGATSAVKASPTGATASAPPAATAASSSAKAPAPKVKTPAPVNSTPATPAATAPKAPAASTAPQVSVSSSAGVKVAAASTTNPTGVGTKSLGARITMAAYKHVPKKTIGVIGAAAAGGVVLSQRGKVGVPGGSKGELTGGLKAEDQWVNDIEDATLRENVKGLFSVKYAQGEEGLRSLVEGLQAAKQTPEFISDAALASPETSARFSGEYKQLKQKFGSSVLGGKRYDPNKNPDEAVLAENAAKQELLKRVRARQHTLLKSKVDVAYKKIVAQRKTEEERSKNR